MQNHFLQTFITSYQIAVEAVQLLKEKRNEPFFLGVGFHKPHDPFIAPKKYFDLYPLNQITLHRDPADRSPEEPFALPSGMYTQFKAFTDQERKEFKRAYLAGVSFMDAQVGKVLYALEQNKLWDNTIIVFIGDHGYHLGERGWWNKNTLFELSSRAHLMIYAPKAKGKGKASPALVEFVDLYPSTKVPTLGEQAHGPEDGRVGVWAQDVYAQVDSGS